MKKILKIVTRQSRLALWQAKFVQKKLQFLNPNLAVEIIGVMTEGDKRLDIPLSETGGKGLKGLFVKALEEYLLDQQADIAVHSLKDMPAELPEGLELAAILEREDPRDAFISLHFPNIQSLPPHTVIGTSSLRRQSQLSALKKDLSLKVLRGNIDTRIHKLEQGEFDAIILAVAGLKRLGLKNRILEYLPYDVMLPAPGQGALCIECRIKDKETKHLIAPLHHLPTAQCVLAERSMSAILGGGCQLPIAAIAHFTPKGMLMLQGMVGSVDGATILRAESLGKPDAMMEIGEQVAKQLLAKGAIDIINACG